MEEKRTRRRFTREFEIEAVQLVKQRDGKVIKFVNNLGIHLFYYIIGEEHMLMIPNMLFLARESQKLRMKSYINSRRRIRISKKSVTF